MTEPSPPSADRLRLDIARLNDFLARAFPHGEPGARGVVTALDPGRLTMMQQPHERLLRPGGVVSGPAMMGLADAGVYAMVLAHIGEVPMAVTTSLTMHFLRAAKPGPLTAQVRLLRLGRRIATCDAFLWTEAPDRPCAQATVAYAIPDGTR
jgi:uncharacterized protein (TIGR00369 family)